MPWYYTLMMPTVTKEITKFISKHDIKLRRHHNGNIAILATNEFSGHSTTRAYATPTKYDKILE